MRVSKGVGGAMILAVLVALLGVLVAGAASAQGTVNCAEFPGTGDKTDPYVISGILEGDLEVTQGVCHVIGTVMGDVIIKDEVCAGYPDNRTVNGDKPYTALSVAGGAHGGTIHGSTMASGGACVMEWLGEGATIGGNVVFDAGGNMVFKNVVGGEPVVIGAIVNGNILMKDGHLSASGSAGTNVVDGNIICDGGEPSAGLGSGSNTDWDGSGDADGTIGGKYLCGPVAQAQAGHINIFDMNDRNASVEYAATGTGVSVVNGTSIDFKIIAENLAPIEVWEVIVTIRDPAASPADSFAQITFEATSDENGKLAFEKNNFNLELLPPGRYRVDWILAHADFTEPGRTGTGKALHAKLGRDAILSCQPATFVIVPE